MTFSSRLSAAKLLADKLKAYKDKGAVVYALPRGGVALGRVIADMLGASRSIWSLRVVILEKDPFYLGAVGSCYDEFTQVEDAEVIKLMKINQ